MHNKYKANHIKDAQRAKIKGIVFATCMSFFIFALLIFAIYFIKTKLQKNENDSITNDMKNDTVIEFNDGKNNIIDEIEDTIENNLGDGLIGEENNIELDSENSTTDNKKEFIYGERVPQSEAVLEEYFDDAVFIGNSQIEGISIYSSMNNATILAGKGIMVDTIFTKEVVKTKDGNRITIMEALSRDKFGKVYIMLGANELGWAYDYMFIEQYAKVIDEIKNLQPDAQIYVNAIMPVSKEKSEQDKIYNNNNIDNYNKLILNMTKDKEVYYLDSKEALADEKGNLPEDAGTDGIHFNATYYEKWFNYLKTHTVYKEREM